MDKLKYIDQKIRKLTHESGRPFLCDGSPIGCNVALVGINPGTPTKFWPYWDVNKGFDKSKWLEKYLDIHGRLKPTRDRIEEFCKALQPERCLELNLTHHYTPNEKTLSKAQLADTEVFSFMIQTVKPKILLVHGNKPIFYLEKIMKTSIEKEKFNEVEYEGLPILIYAAKSHFSRGVSREYVRELAEKIKAKLETL